MRRTAGGDAGRGWPHADQVAGGNQVGMRTVHPMADVEPVPTTPTTVPDTEPAVVTTANWSPTQSPDGVGLAFVSNRSGEPRLWVRPTPDAEATMPGVGSQPVTKVRWSHDGAWLAYGVAPGGAARTEVWIMRPDGSEQRQVAGFGDCSATFGAWSHGTPSWLPVASSAGQWSPAQAFLFDPSTGEHEALATGGLLHALDVSPDHGLALVRHGPRTARWVELVDVRTGATTCPVPKDPSGSTDIGHFALDGTVVLLRSDVGRDLAALIAARVDGGPTWCLAERDDAELEDLTVSGDGRTAVLLWNVNGGRSALSALDITSGERRDLPGPPGDVYQWCKLADDGARLLVVSQAPAQPRNIWAVDVATGDAKPVTYGPPQVVPSVPLRPELRRFRGEDGLELSGWLYRAAAADAGPQPVLLYFHGGPEGQHRPAFNPLFRELVSRGLTVFAPNVRGSSGFGRRFVNADNLDKRFVALTDVRAAVTHLVEAGIADAGRVGCMGRSYGGYLTLVALSRFAELFAVGVDVCGMVDLQTFYANTEPWIAEAAYSKYGHPERDADLLRRLSPIHHIDELRAPLLVVHGANDTNVPLHEAEQVAAALDARRVPCELLVFRDEGHELLKTANRAYFVQTVGDWLTRHLDL
jgi:dipeptidyl aminopeptidase/acylaminoacyl peptidase